MPLRPFTLIGATTRAGLISAPLRDRFVVREHLDYYSVPELAEIVGRSAGKLTMPMDAATADEVARRSRGTPRLANNRLRWIRDFSTSRADGRVDVDIARSALEMQGIDELGLDGFDRRYLETIQRVFAGGPVGIEAIAHTMSTAADTLEDDVEPFLLRCELVVRTPRGRRLTVKGEEHLGAPPQRGGQPALF
jgi:Holliday junction DNA helicase RuvB